MFSLLSAFANPIQKMMLVGALAGSLILAGYFYGVSVTNASHALAAAQQKARDLTVIAATQAADDQSRFEDQNRIRDLTILIEETRRDLADKDRTCLEPADTERLRKLWR